MFKFTSSGLESLGEPKPRITEDDAVLIADMFKTFSEEKPYITKEVIENGKDLLHGRRAPRS